MSSLKSEFSLSLECGSLLNWLNHCENHNRKKCIATANSKMQVIFDMDYTNSPIVIEL